ncbi:hypothetical protein DSECCO2_327760 [anaerobic digester metagenome]
MQDAMIRLIAKTDPIQLNSLIQPGCHGVTAISEIGGNCPGQLVNQRIGGLSICQNLRNLGDGGYDEIHQLDEDNDHAGSYSASGQCQISSCQKDADLSHNPCYRANQLNQDLHLFAGSFGLLHFLIDGSKVALNFLLDTKALNHGKSAQDILHQPDKTGVAL